MSDSNFEDIHPIIKKAFNLVSKRSIYAPLGIPEPDSSLFFDEEAIEELKDELSTYFHSPDLPTVVMELLKLAYFLDQKGAKEASEAIITIVNTAVEPLEAWMASRDRVEELNDF